MHSIGQASRLSGVSIETIRYYERTGIISAAQRTESGRRVYSEVRIAELRFIKRCRDLGFSMRDAVALRDLSREPEAACATVETVARRHLGEVREKISQLKLIESALEELVGNCASGLLDCPLLEQLMGAPNAEGPAA